MDVMAESSQFGLTLSAIHLDHFYCPHPRYPIDRRLDWKDAPPNRLKGMREPIVIDSCTAVGIFLSLAVTACSQQTGRGVAKAQAEASPAVQNDPESAPEPSATAPAQPESTPSGELGQILQAALDARPLQEYFHAEERPERTPLVILKNDVVRNEPRLQMFGKPVLFISHPQGSRPYLEFTAVRREDKTAQVQLEYPIEGLRATLRLERTLDGWKVRGALITEKIADT